MQNSDNIQVFLKCVEQRDYNERDICLYEHKCIMNIKLYLISVIMRYRFLLISNYLSSLSVFRTANVPGESQ